MDANELPWIQERIPPPPQQHTHPEVDTKPTKHKGRFQQLNTFVDTRMETLSRSELAVWFCLYRDTKPDGTVQVSQNDIARRAGCKVLAVKRAIPSLGNKGLLRVVKKGNNLTHEPSIYRLLG